MTSANDLSDVTELDLIDVTLLPAVPGPPEIAHLGLGFDARGLTVRRRDGSTVALIPWASIVRLSCEQLGGRSHQLPTEMRIDVESIRSRHRFVVPNVQPEALGRSLASLSGLYARDDHVLSGVPTR